MAESTTRRPTRETGTTRVKRGMAEMLKGGVIMDVVTAEQAKIAEDAGAVAVMALERVPADIRAQGGGQPDERPRHDRQHHRGRLDPRDGEGPHRPLRRGPGAPEPRRRLRRRVRGAHARRLRPPHRQVGVHRAVRVRRHQPRRGAAPDLRGRGDDPLQGRGRHRRRLERRHPHAHDPPGDPAAGEPPRGRAVRRRQGAPGALRPRRGGGAHRRPPRRACSPPVASPPRPTPR